MKLLRIIITALLGFVILFALLSCAANFIVEKQSVSQNNQPKSEIMEKVEQFAGFSQSVKDYTVEKTLNFVGVTLIDEQNAQPEDYLTVMNKAGEIADFSAVSKEYAFTKAINIAGTNAVFAEYPQTGQYMAIVNTGTLVNINKNDLQTGILRQTVIDYAAKYAPPGIKINKLDVAPRGNLFLCHQSVPYASVKIRIFRNRTETTYQGMVGIVTDPETNKNELIVSGHRKGYYEQKIAENFFKDVKLQ